MKGRRTALSAFLLALLLSIGACGGAAEGGGVSGSDRLSAGAGTASRGETNDVEGTDGKDSVSSSETQNSSAESSSQEDSPTGDSSSDSSTTGSSDSSSDSSAIGSSDNSSDSSAEAREVFLHLHFNSPFPVEDKILVLPQIAGETADMGNAEDVFIRLNERAAQTKLLTAGVDLKTQPVYRFSGWAYDREGVRPFGGLVPDTRETPLYAVWIRSEKYVKLSLCVEKELLDAYYLVKGAPFTQAAADKLTGRYAELGIETDGIFTADGEAFAVGSSVEEDVKLFPRRDPAKGKN